MTSERLVTYVMEMAGFTPVQTLPSPQDLMFAGHRRGLAFRMKDGDRVVVGGAVDVYERDGRYQLYAKEILICQ